MSDEMYSAGCGEHYRFWSVVRPGMVPDVLSRVEHSERQTSQEISGRQQASYRSQLETCHACKKTRDSFEFNLF